jgi:hypothetical protein
VLGDPTIGKSDRFTVDIFGRPQQVYFRGYLDATQASGPNAGRLVQLVPTDFSKRTLTKVGANDNLISQVLADGSVVPTDPTAGMVSWNARNFYQGPGSWNEDISIYKDFKFAERYRLRFTGDFFNAFNHPNSVLPDTTTGLLDLSQQINDPRIIQLSAKFEF